MYWLGDRFSSLLLLSKTRNNFVWNSLCLQQISPPKQVEKTIILAQVIIHIARINQLVQETLKLLRLESTKGEAVRGCGSSPGLLLTCSSRALTGAAEFPVPAPLPEQPGRRKAPTHS